MKIVMTALVGDLFHVGHLRLLESAKLLGDKLIVAVASDYAVEVETRKKLKTVIPQEERVEMINALKCVDVVVLYWTNDDLKKLIEEIRPDIICRGDDWKDFPGKETAEKLGIEIVYFPYTKGVSSTEIKRRCYDELVRSGEPAGPTQDPR